MIFFSALLSFVFNASGLSVSACDADWMDWERFEEMLRAELADLDGARQGEMGLTIDECTDDSVSLHVTDTDGTRDRTISLDRIPAEARMRTVAIALGELAAEQTVENEIPKTPESMSMAIEASPPATECEPAVMEPPVDKTPPACAPVSPVDASPEGGLRVALGAYFRAFPLTKTFAPELRLGLRWQRWRFDIGGYAMGWKETIGTVYLTAFTFIVDRSLWQHEGAVFVSFDAMAELGAVAAFGKASTDKVHETPKVNLLSGAHLGISVGPGRTSTFFPAFKLEVGWVRGLNLYAGGDFIAGFEGVSSAAGFEACW